MGANQQQRKNKENNEDSFGYAYKTALTLQQSKQKKFADRTLSGNSTFVSTEAS